MKLHLFLIWLDLRLSKVDLFYNTKEEFLKILWRWYQLRV